MDDIIRRFAPTLPKVRRLCFDGFEYVSSLIVIANLKFLVETTLLPDAIVN